ncbi:hypothetical protein GSI_13241 [Ganoderma sinense ZZ0214-1]|uniref:Uncharacterized protein n=1 Tax=Ganoderma sinense ZZ0214-1 TaxID=1077348 RepID=A0A2G8RV09_9APHY|nr:hypothetical protein GSI_13241 [Ganoderma sinense ZZ0214-1]
MAVLSTGQLPTNLLPSAHGQDRLRRLATEIDLRACVPHRDQVTISASTFKGDLQAGCGVTRSVYVPEVYGTIRMWIKEDFCEPHASLWIEFDLPLRLRCRVQVQVRCAFHPVRMLTGVMPVSSRWFISSGKLVAGKGAVLTATLTSALGELEASSISVHNEMNNITNIVAPVAVAVAATAAA